jgi:uncharacterized membrane protein YkoI
MLSMAVVALLLTPLLAFAQHAGKPAASQIPGKVMQALRTRFPAAEVHKWTRETENKAVVYDVEFTQQGQQFEADIKEDGAIVNWERGMAAQDLPAAVSQAVEKKYPRATISEVMMVTAVRDGKDALEGYEVTLKTAAGRNVEVTVAPDGKILENSGAEKP